MVLPVDFHIYKYRLDCRLADESDSGFILALRTDDVLSRYIHATDNDLQSQIDWMRAYKKRERAGEDYYFIFSYEGERVGVCRLYAIHDNHFTFGSWLFKRDIPFFCSIAAAVIAREIAFDILGLEIEIEKDGTHEDNKKVWKFSKQLGMVFNGKKLDEKGVYLTGFLTKEAFEMNKPDVCRFLEE